jgi:uncharacterized membrane protein YkvA (DUF1232 family)
MTSLESRCLESFPAWLRALADDSRSLAAALSAMPSESLPESAGRGIASALTYLIKSIDLIPDGLSDLGYIDDAFILRVCVASIPEADRGPDPNATLARLAQDTELLREFLPDDYARLESFCEGLQRGSAHGRKVEEVLADVEARAALVSDVRAWADSFSVPAFSRDARTLVKLRSFLKNRLP